VGDERLKIELEKYTQFLKSHESFTKGQEKMKQATILNAEKWRKSHAKSYGEYDEKKAAAELQRLDALDARKRAKEMEKVDTMSDVEPDDPVPVTIDENANAVKDDEGKIVSAASDADVPPLVDAAPIDEPVIISSDENNGNDNDKDVVDDDVDLHKIGAEVAENLWGIVFDISDDANIEYGIKHPSRVGCADDFGVHDLNWQPTLSEMWMDVTDWTDDEGHGIRSGQGLGVRPDSTTAEVTSELRETVPSHQDTTSPADEGPPKFPVLSNLPRLLIL